MVNIDRNRDQGGLEVARQRIIFCLEAIEKSTSFANGLDWTTHLMTDFDGGSGQPTIEELIGALVAVEQVLKETD